MRSMEAADEFFTDDFNLAELAVELLTLNKLFFQRANGCAKATVKAPEGCAD